MTAYTLPAADAQWYRLRLSGLLLREDGSRDPITSR